MKKCAICSREIADKNQMVTIKKGMKILRLVAVLPEEADVELFVKECRSIGINVSNMEFADNSDKRVRAYFYIQNDSEYDSLIELADKYTVNYVLVDHTDRLIGDDVVYL